MTVRVNEPGQQSLSLKIDDPRRGGRQLANSGTRSRRRDPAVPDRHSLSGAARRVHCDHGGVDVGDVGHRRLHLRPPARGDGGRGDHGCDQCEFLICMEGTHVRSRTGSRTTAAARVLHQIAPVRRATTVMTTVDPSAHLKRNR